MSERSTTGRTRAAATPSTSPAQPSTVITGPPTRRAQTSFAVPGYRWLWATGGLWHAARWMAVFTTTYRVNEITGDPLLVQLVGTFFMAPMFLGGAVAGTITDRIDRNRTIVVSLSVLVPLSGMMGLAVATDRASVGVFYAFVFMVGVGNVLDMTCRRSIAFDLVGASLITNAAAYETFALHAGNMVGALFGGLALEAVGASAAYLGLGAVYAVALVAFARSRADVRRASAAVEGSRVGAAADATQDNGSDPPPGERVSIGDDLRRAYGLVRSHPLLRRFLVTTVAMNFFFYAFMPLVPAFAEDLGVGPFLTGLLAAGVGIGSMTGSAVIARVQPRRRGLLHVVGAFGAMTMLIVFANATWYPLALAALVLAGVSGSGFGTTQSALTISLADESLRGRALGLLSMAIGALPFGMFTLGLLARQVDPHRALTISVGTGMVLLAAWHLARPELRRLP